MDNVENLILEHLRAIRMDVGSVKEDVREIKSRIAALEAGQATLLQHIGHQASATAQQHVSYERIERIEQRLELL